MNIKYLTLTGADDNSAPKELAELSKQYPFVEWAILISEQREGTARYPTRGWREAFHLACPNSNTSAHLCGKEVLSRLAAEDTELAEELKHYQRVQLNFNAKHTDEALLEGLIRCTTSGFYKHKSGVNTKFITQFNQANVEITARFINAHQQLPSNHHILFDASGGLGRSPDYWPTTIPKKLCGYAGGLGPDNLYHELNELYVQLAQGGNQTVWIDMESKLRTDEVFDLEKVRAVLEIVDVFQH